MRTIRVLWVGPDHALRGHVAEAPDRILESGTFEPGMADGGFCGPAGRYDLLPEEVWRTMAPDDPAPTFLHESYEALLEKWVNSLSDAAAEVAIVARVRDAVMQLVETRLAADDEAFSVSPTVTTTEPSHGGMVVVGRSVLLRPARVRRPAEPPAARGSLRRDGT